MINVFRYSHRTCIDILQKKRHRYIAIEETLIYCQRRGIEILSKKMYRDIAKEKA